MATSLRQNLLGSSASEASPRSRQVLVAATIVGLVLSASYAGYSVGKMSAIADGGDSTVSQTTDLFGSFPRNPWCYAFTGEMCPIGKCSADGGGVCRFPWGRCECPAGCAGADGKCYPHMVNYTQIGRKIKFDSVRYPGNWLHLQDSSIWNRWNQVRFSDARSWTWSGQQYFDIYELPGRGKQGEKRYFVASEKWQSWVASVMAAGNLKGRLHPYAFYDKNLNWQSMPWKPYKVTLDLCHVRGKPNVVQMGRPVLNGDHWEWADVHKLSEFVDAWDEKAKRAGDGGQWTTMDANDMPVKLDVEECP